jgi:hypothetical protein
VKQTTVRFSEGVYRLVEREARQAGVTVAQYVREATLARAAYAAGQREDPLLSLFSPRDTEEGEEAGFRGEDS